MACLSEMCKRAVYWFFVAFSVFDVVVDVLAGVKMYDTKPMYGLMLIIFSAISFIAVDVFMKITIYMANKHPEWQSEADRAMNIDGGWVELLASISMSTVFQFMLEDATTIYIFAQEETFDSGGTFAVISIYISAALGVVSVLGLIVVFYTVCKAVCTNEAVKAQNEGTSPTAMVGVYICMYFVWTGPIGFMLYLAVWYIAIGEPVPEEYEDALLGVYITSIVMGLVAAVANFVSMVKSCSDQSQSQDSGREWQQSSSTA